MCNQGMLHSQGRFQALNITKKLKRGFSGSVPEFQDNEAIGQEESDDMLRRIKDLIAGNIQARDVLIKRRCKVSVRPPGVGLNPISQRKFSVVFPAGIAPISFRDVVLHGRCCNMSA